MFVVEFYENKKGESPLWDFLEKLREEKSTNKDSRIQYNQIVFYIELLQNDGTRLPEKIVKHLNDGIWELRPGNNRILFFCYKDNVFVLLHHFRKKTQKTPQREIEKAKKERDDYILRNEG